MELVDDPLSGAVIGIAIDVHRAFGPGCLESAYEKALGWGLRERGVEIRTQVRTPVVYRGLRIDPAYCVDMLVAEQLIVEVKAVDALLKVHEAQLLTYMRLMNIPVGLLINFRVAVLKDGIRRLVL